MCGCVSVEADKAKLNNALGFICSVLTSEEGKSEVFLEQEREAKGRVQSLQRLAKSVIFQQRTLVIDTSKIRAETSEKKNTRKEVRDGLRIITSLK